MGNAVWHGAGFGSLEATDLGSNPSLSLTHGDSVQLSEPLSLHLHMVVMVIRPCLIGSLCRFREVLCVRT